MLEAAKPMGKLVPNDGSSWEFGKARYGDKADSMRHAAMWPSTGIDSSTHGRKREKGHQTAQDIRGVQH